MGQLLLSRKQRKLIGSLRRRKGRQEHGLFLVEGVRGAEACLGAGWAWSLAVVAPESLRATPRGGALLRRLAAVGEPVVECSEAELRGLAPTQSPQGVLLAAALQPARLDSLVPPEGAVCLVLDGVQDPGNVGTLIRTAHALGGFAAIALAGTADPWAPKAARAAAGALFHLPVVSAAGPEAFDWLRPGFEILGADAAGAPLERAPRERRPRALVLGNEGAGLSEAARSWCGRIVSIPVVPSAESLNVAVAGALLLDRLLHD